MFSDILSAIKSVFDITNSIKAEKVKSVLLILITLTIVLVKPTIYYANLYIGFCYLFAAIFICAFSFIIFYKIYRRKTRTDYDKATTNSLLVFLAIISIIILAGKIRYTAIWSDVFSTEHTTAEAFIENIHHLEYFNAFYSYVRSKFLIVLLYSIEFTQTIFILYFAGHIFHKLLCTEEPLQTGFISSDFKTILFHNLMITLTSPVFFSHYTEFWNKIF